MGKERPGAMLYWETFDTLCRMSPERVKRMIQAIYRYARDAETPDLSDDEALYFLWPEIERRLAADAARYEEKCKKAQSAAITRWESERNASASECMQTHAGAYESTINPADTTKTGESQPPIPPDSMHPHAPASDSVRNMPTTTTTSTPTSTPISSTAYAHRATAAQENHTGLYRDEAGRDYITLEALRER